jgi:mannose-6-phosphate isomerase-like protein (cupin superfamily)
MLVEYDMVIVKKVWGKEEILVNEPEYCCKKLHLTKQYRCSIHYHEVKKETFILEYGLVFLEIASRHRPEALIVMWPGMSITIEQGECHRFTGIEDSMFIEVSTHDDPEDSIRVTFSEKMLDQDFNQLVSQLKGMDL